MVFIYLIAAIFACNYSMFCLTTPTLHLEKDNKFALHEEFLPAIVDLISGLPACNLVMHSDVYVVQQQHLLEQL